MALQRSTLARIFSTLAFQTNGFGCRLFSARYSLIAAMRSWTLAKLPRRMRFWLNSRNHRSTRFSQDCAGGREVQMEPPMLGEPRRDAGMFVRAVVVDDQVEVQLGRRLPVHGAQEAQELLINLLNEHDWDVSFFVDCW